MRLTSICAAGLLLVVSCTNAPAAPSSTTTTRPVVTGGTGVLVPPVDAVELRNQDGYVFPSAPEVPKGDPAPELVEALDQLFGSLDQGIDILALEAAEAVGDFRVAWLWADLVRFIGPSEARNSAIGAFERMSGVDLLQDPVGRRSTWQSMTDHLMAWDTPALPGYREWKAALFTLVDPRWEPFFSDADAAIDWRHVSWGGVPVDDRPLGDPNPCPLGCIPALDDPAVTDATGGDWYPDDRIVFGVVIDGEARAYPKHIMEIHEMVNDTLGGRRIGVPYCTLCGSAQAYLTDSVPDGIATPLLRTSGLLIRSNKVMFDLETWSIFDTFTGEAVSGPLQDEGVALEQISVVTSTWGAWKAAHPDTTIVAADGGIGRVYPLDPLRGRDDNRPIFPIGDVDERLPVQEQVLGVIAPDGTPVAFPVALARAAIDAGSPVTARGVTLVPEGSGVRAILDDGSDAVGHQAFWFAWSQFHPGTEVWSTG